MRARSLRVRASSTASAILNPAPPGAWAPGDGVMGAVDVRRGGGSGGGRGDARDRGHHEGRDGEDSSGSRATQHGRSRLEAQAPNLSRRYACVVGGGSVDRRTGVSGRRAGASCAPAVGRTRSAHDAGPGFENGVQHPRLITCRRARRRSDRTASNRCRPGARRTPGRPAPSSTAAKPPRTGARGASPPARASAREPARSAPTRGSRHDDAIEAVLPAGLAADEVCAAHGHVARAARRLERARPGPRAAGGDAHLRSGETSPARPACTHFQNTYEPRSSSTSRATPGSRRLSASIPTSRGALGRHSTSCVISARTQSCSPEQASVPQ